MYISRYRNKYCPYVPIIQVGKFEVYNFLKVYYIWVAEIRFQFCSLALKPVVIIPNLPTSWQLILKCKFSFFTSFIPSENMPQAPGHLITDALWRDNLPLPQPSLYFAQPPALPSPFLTPKRLAPVRCKIKLQTSELVPAWGAMIDCHSLIIWKVWEWVQKRDDHRTVRKKFVSLFAAPLLFANVCWFPFSLFVIKNPAEMTVGGSNSQALYLHFCG